MKTTFFLPLILVFITLASCSGSDDNEDNQASSLSVTVNGEPLETFSCRAVKVNDHFYLSTQNFKLDFEKDGTFGKTWTRVFPPLGPQKDFWSFRNYSSNYYDFNLESVDEVHHRIKGNFYGLAYFDPENLQSEAKYVGGEFDMKYTVQPGNITGLSNNVMMNGVPWKMSTHYVKRREFSSNSHDLTLHTVNDGPFEIVIHFRQFTTPLGPQPFTSQDSNYKILVGKFDVATASYTYYEGSGVLNISATGEHYVYGTYTFDGVNPDNPGDVISLSGGSFRLDFYY